MLLFVGCLTSQQQDSVYQERICSDNFTCCHTEIEAADQTFYLTQSQCTGTEPTSPSADPITLGAGQGSHWTGRRKQSEERQNIADSKQSELAPKTLTQITVPSHRVSGPEWIKHSICKPVQLRLTTSAAMISCSVGDCVVDWSLTDPAKQKPKLSLVFTEWSSRTDTHTHTWRFCNEEPDDGSVYSKTHALCFTALKTECLECSKAQQRRVPIGFGIWVCSIRGRPRAVGKTAWGFPASYMRLHVVIVRDT